MRRFMGTRRQCGFLWKMLTAKSSCTTSTFCWRASLPLMNIHWSSLCLYSSRCHLSISSGLCQISGLVSDVNKLHSLLVLFHYRTSEENWDTDMYLGYHLRKFSFEVQWQRFEIFYRIYARELHNRFVTVFVSWKVQPKFFQVCRL